MCEACTENARTWLREHGPIEGVDVPRLRKAVEWAEAEANRPRPRWNQAYWFKVKNFRRSMAGSKVSFVDCGTTACIAGWICATEGDQFIVDSDGTADQCVYLDEQGRENYDHIESRALTLLGLNDSEDASTAGSALFNGSIDIVAVRKIAEMIAGEPL